MDILTQNQFVLREANIDILCPRATMQTLEHTFTFLQYLGLWRPVEWPSHGWKTNLYYCYTLCIVLLLSTVIFTEIIEMINSLNDVEALANNSFMLLTMIASGGKGTNILIKRGEIIALTKVLQTDPCKPKTEEELAIQHKFDIWIRSATIRCWTLASFTLLSLTLKSILEDIPQRLLPYEAWIPFDYYESGLSYSIVYVHQTTGLFVGTGFCISFDALVSGLMLQTCSQLHILKHRLNELPYIVLDNDRNIRSRNKCNELKPDLESKLLSQCVRHHLEIFKFAKTSNELFGIAILIQYTTSTLVLCMSVLSLSRMTLFSSEFTTLFMYASCMTIEIFIYCYCGCEVTLESLTVSDVIYATNWISLSIKTQRSLLTIMTRTLRPIEFTSYYVLTLNLDYFNSLLKLSYSVYNVLQRSAE